MKIRELLVELVAAYATRGVGHTTCALRSMGVHVESATIRPLMVVATRHQGSQVAPMIGRDGSVSLGEIAGAKLRGQRRALVWDNHAIETMILAFDRELVRLDRKVEEGESLAASQRRRLWVADREIGILQQALRRATKESANLREQLADARAELEMAHASAPRY